MSKCLFITGTGTDVGKTYVTALVVKKLRQAGFNAGYYKAAISGAELSNTGELLPGDALYVNEIAALGEKTSNLVSYVYKEAVSPHLAAKLNNLPIDMSRIVTDFTAAKSRHEFLTVEGSGGIVCPLRWDKEEHLRLDDMVKQLNLPVLIVSPAGLGTLNDTVLTIEHLHSVGIPIKGAILNGYHQDNVMEDDNRRMIEEMTGVNVVATVADNATELEMDVHKLAALYE